MYVMYVCIYGWIDEFVLVPQHLEGSDSYSVLGLIPGTYILIE
jgi:hypothetical protein